MKKSLLVLFILSAFCCISPAHDLEIKTFLKPPAAYIQASYSGTEPMSYASVLVYSPADRKTEFQNGRTDALGRFAFLPDRAGAWSVIIDDEMGHKENVKISVDEDFLSGSATGGESRNGFRTFQKLIIGISIILGTTGIVFWLKARKLLQKVKK